MAHNNNAGKIAQLTTNRGEENILATTFGGFIEALTGLTPTLAAEKGVAFEQLYAYVSVYASFGLITLLVGLLALGLAPLVSRWM